MFLGDYTGLAALDLIAKVACIIHVLRSQRNFMWIWLILFFPIGGPLIYFIVEVWPDVSSRRGAKNFKLRPLNPEREIQRLTEELEFSNTVNKRADLARAYAAARRYPEAIETVGACLRGAFKDDPLLILALAEIHFQAGQYTEALAALAELERLKYRDGRESRLLLAARCHEKLGQKEAARSCYERALQVAIGEEARCRFALFLASEGDHGGARQLCEEIARNARHGGGAYRRANREWIRDARELLAASGQ